MKLDWTVTDEDVSQVRKFAAAYSNNPLVQDRTRRNLAESKPKVSRQRFWQRMVAARLTSQQKSGPESHVARFIRSRPFPLAYETCCAEGNPARFITSVLTKAGGIRFTDTIGTEMAANLQSLDAGAWKQTNTFLNRLRASQEREAEIAAADYIQDTFLGFGPKQPRNVLQALGLTRYEIPIDSRVTNWLNRFGFPVHLNAGALSDRHYYRFVMDGIQVLCKRAEVMPCILDAAIFVSFDKDVWTKANADY